MKIILQTIKHFYLRFLATMLVHDREKLTPKHLADMGWIRTYNSTLDNYYWLDKDTKDRDKTWIIFEDHNYRVYHGPTKTFIAAESSLSWFRAYYLILHSDNGRHELTYFKL